MIRLRRAARPVTDGPAAALLAALTPHPPLLLTHPSVRSPFLAGTRRPAIFLPPAFAADFGPDALRAVFLHELAHRDRRDNLWTLAARLLTALLWFQPLLWLLGRKLEQISEDACDAAVLAADCPPRAYAACLLSLAERPPLARLQRTLTAGVAPFRSSVGRRISRILTEGVPIMPAVTLRLRLTIAALTVAASIGGAFLVSSAPAQTQPIPASVVGIWKMRTVAIISDREVPYQNIYRFDSNKTGLYRIDIGKGPGRPKDHPEFHVAYPFTWSEAADTIMINLPSSGADRVNEQETGLLSSDGQVLHITKRQWQMKFWSGSSWKLSEMRTASDDLRVFRQGIRPSFSLKGGQPFMSSALSNRQQTLRQITAELSNYSGKKPSKVIRNAPVDQANLLAGLTPVQGPGVVVTLTDSKKPFPYPKGFPAGMIPPNIIHDSDINQVVNELRAAGAEAIAINNQRLIATSAVRCAGPTVYINNTPQEPPFVIQAIGDPKALTAMLTASGGIASQMRQFDPAMFFIRQAATLTLPAYAGQGEMHYAKPVSAADVPATPAPPSKVIVTLDSRGSYFLDSVQLPESQIESFLAARVRQNPNLTAVIRAAKNQPYSRVVKLIDVLKQAGIQSIAVATLTSSSTSHQAQVKDEIVKYRDKTRTKFASDQTLLDQDEQNFQAELRQALPQAGAATLTKASNLESGLGGLVASMQFTQQLVKHYAGKHYSSASEAKKYAQANQGHLETIAARRAQIRPLLAEEAHLFPMTAQSQQHLAQVHTLAIKAHMMGINVMVDTLQLQVLDQRIRQR